MLHVQFVQKRIWEFGVLVALGLAWGPVHVYAVGEERSQRGPLPPGHLHAGKSKLQITGDPGGWQLHLRKETRAGAPGARHAWQGREKRRQRNQDSQGRFIGQIRCTEAANEANPEMGIRATPQKFICL